MLKRFSFASIAFIALVSTVAPCTASYIVSARVSFGVARFSSLNPIGDFDGDGRLEVVLIHPGSPPFARIYDAMAANDSDFKAEIPLPELPCCTPSVATAMNLDDDLLPEIVAISYTSEHGDGGYVVIDFVGTTAAPSSVEARPAPETTIRPNPFNPSATIDYSVPKTGIASLQIYDASGRLVRTLLERMVEPGKQSVTWDGRDGGGQVLPSGTYFYSLSLDGQVLAKGRAVLLK
jgi:hypothetical protein